MKKLMMAVAIVCAAVMAHAAQVTWSANAIVPSGTSTSYFAMIVDVTGIADATADSVANAIVAGTFTGNTMYSGAAVYNASKSQVAVAFSKKTVNGEYANEQDVSYMTIVFDAAAAADAKNYLVTSGDAPAAGKFSAAGLLAVAQGSQASKTWTAVAPEPTSGLLMLVGLAGLALRRRRA
jgi:hypothetical protein